jgi:CTP:molybdopterin cytidylyltransferase MocA
MGRPKAGLPLSDRGDTFLSRILRTLAAAGLPDIVVVTGAATEAVRVAAGRVRRPVRFLHNERWQEGQLTSLLTGLGVPDDHLLEAVLVMLVDAPLASSDTVARVVGAWRASRAPVVRPARGEVHGHPVIFDRAVFDDLRAADPQIGAKAVVRAHSRDILNLPVDDRGAFVDIDTEDEYRTALSLLQPKAAAGSATPSLPPAPSRRA